MIAEVAGAVVGIAAGVVVARVRVVLVPDALVVFVFWLVFPP